MEAIMVPEEGRPRYAPGSELLVGVDGNAFAIMAAVRRWLRDAEASREFIDAYTKEAMAGDYDHLLQASMAYLEAE